MPADSTFSDAPRGTLVLLGGGDDDPMLTLLANMLPGSSATIEVLTTATRRQPARTAAAYAHALHQLGCPHVRHLQVDENHPADDPATLMRLRRATLVFMSGGDQERITDFLLNTEFLAILKAKYQNEPDFIVAGTSAGASALAECMLVYGHGWRSLKKGNIDVKPGLNLLPGLLLDQHFAERGRYPRLMHAALAQPDLLGIGLSEETGLIVRGGQPMEVFGDEVVVVIDAAQLKHNNLPDLAEGQMISAHGLQVHLLVAGQQLDLATRQVML
ncbi:cyanophycinase [Hymenobacter arizonensis]|uniref:Cyanophycinase n=1 Tax=Hymenobacter arizonensis TaxID=1227077 RepID=A0A1I5XM33_HYMAR|nr:cyanophycinase [Hymenobacter arizonensis]SFQ32970.1 cyanophycinase [Hymenobacter arizonensis]